MSGYSGHIRVSAEMTVGLSTVNRPLPSLESSLTGTVWASCRALWRARSIGPFGAFAHPLAPVVVMQDDTMEALVDDGGVPLVMLEETMKKTGATHDVPLSGSLIIANLLG